MRLFDYTSHINEDGFPVLVLTIEVPLSVDIFSVPDEVRLFLDSLVKNKLAEKRND